MRIVYLLMLVPFALSSCNNKPSSTDSNNQQTSPDSRQNELDKVRKDSAVLALTGVWQGTLDDKPIILVIEKVAGDNISGSNTVGSTTRPIKGKYKYLNSGWNMNVTLNEPGDNKWDGVFDIDFSESAFQWSGEGTWKSNNGNLARVVSIKKVERTNYSSGSDCDKFIGIWIKPTYNGGTDYIYISANENGLKVKYKPFQDYDFEDNAVKCDGNAIQVLQAFRLEFLTTDKIVMKDDINPQQIFRRKK